MNNTFCMLFRKANVYMCMEGKVKLKVKPDDERIQKQSLSPYDGIQTRMVESGSRVTFV